MFYWENNISEKYELSWNITSKHIFVELVVNAAADKMRNYGSSLSTDVSVMLKARTMFSIT